jgi:hypothetical protein
METAILSDINGARGTEEGGSRKKTAPKSSQFRTVSGDDGYVIVSKKESKGEEEGGEKGGEEGGEKDEEKGEEIGSGSGEAGEHDEGSKRLQNDNEGRASKAKN